MTEFPLLSIVVPTKNRHRYLSKLVKSLLGMRSHEFEVVVQDNSDSRSDSMRLCKSIRDPRVRYFFEPTPLSMTENCEHGVALARGSFVCMIGDDDGVMECIVDVARWMKSTGIGAAACIVPTYLWPGVSSMLEGVQTRGILRLPRYSGAVHIVTQSAGLEAVLRTGGTTVGGLPSVYQGVVSRDALEALRALAGTCFPGPSPDMANAVGLCAVIDRFAVLDYPIVISGSCPDSGAAEGARHSHEGEIADRKFLPPDTVASWPAAVPFYFSGPTLYAMTLIRALLATGRESLIPKVRFDRLYAACAVFTPAYRSRIEDARAKSPVPVSPFAFATAVCWIWWRRLKALAGNAVYKLAGRLRGDRAMSGLAEIGEVVSYLSERFKGPSLPQVPPGKLR